MSGGPTPRASWLARIFLALALILVFIGALVLGAVFHLNLPAVRRAIERAVNGALSGVSSGPVRLTGLERLTLDRVDVGAVDVDVVGVGRFHAEVVRVSFDALGTVRSLVFERRIAAIHVRHAEVAFVGAAFAFEPRPEAPPSGGAAYEIRLDVDRLVVEHAYVSGRVPDGPPLDVDLDRVRLNGSLDASRLRGTVSTRMTARAIAPEPIEAEVQGNASLPLREAGGEPLSAALDVAASIAGVHVDAHGTLLGDGVDVELDAPEASPESIKRLWSDAPLVAPISGRARFGGTWPHLDAHVDLAVRGGTLRADGPVNLAASPSAELALVGREIDLRAFAERAPASRLGVDAHAHLSVAQAAVDEIPLEGWLSFSTVRSSIEREPLPRASGRITIEPSRQHLTGTIEEEGAPLKVEALRTNNGLIEGSIDGIAPSLAGVPRLARHGLPATGRAVVHADVSVARESLASDVIVDVYRAGVANVGVGAARFEARIDGPFDALRGSVFAHLIALRREPYAVNDLLISANGAPDAFEVSLAGRGGTFDVIAIQTDASWKEGIEIGGLTARVDRADQSVALRADKIAIGRDVASAEGVRIDGCGAPVELRARRAPQSLTAAIAAPAVDLACFGRLVGVPPDRFSGRGSMSLSLDLSRRHNVASGRLDILGAKFSSAPEVDATADFAVDGAAVKGFVTARNRDLGGVRLDANVVLGGTALDPKSLVGSTGRIDFATESLALERVCSALPCPDALRQAIQKSGIVVEAQAEFVREPNESGSGDARVQLRAAARDTRGPLAHLSVSTHVDLSHILETKSPKSDAALEGEFAIEDRSLDELPPNLRPARASGRVGVHGYAEGTVGKPFFVVEVDGAGMRYGNPYPGDSPLDVQWVTTYDLEQAASEIHVRAGSQSVIEGVLQLDASLPSLLAGSDSDWDAGAYVSFDHFPLASVPLEVGERMTGTVSGKISASGLHRQPRIQGHLDVDELRVGRAYAGPVVLTVEADEHRCAASVVTGSPTGGSAETGSGSVRAATICAWKAAALPSIDPRAPIEIAVDTWHFPLGAIGPFVDPWIERLKGRLEAHTLIKGIPANGGRDWSIRGQAHVSEGNMLPLVIGREFKQVLIDVKADGGTVAFHRVSGDVGAGHFEGTASLRLHGLSIAEGKAEIHVPKRKAIPVTAEGVSYGTLWGDVFADAHVANSELQIHLRAPTLRGELPQQTTAELESLKDDPSVVVRQPLGPEKPEVAVGGGPSPGPLPEGVVISFELGDNVGISRDDLKIELTTPPPPANPKVTLDGETRIDGSIRIIGGRVPVAGRVFRVERGTVRFSGDDPADPALDIDAVYESADASGTRIEVHVRGTAKNVKLTLTSSPQKPESELLAILAFGEPMPGTGTVAPGFATPGENASAAAGAGAAAAGVGSAILTSGINQLLSRSIIPIRTRVATGATPLASASVDLTDRVRVEYIRQFGNIRYGQPQDVNQFALDWRFRPRWMLRTVVGDRGTTTLDVLWNRWY